MIKSARCCFVVVVVVNGLGRPSRSLECLRFARPAHAGAPRSNHAFLVDSALRNKTREGFKGKVAGHDVSPSFDLAIMARDRGAFSKSEY